MVIKTVKTGSSCPYESVDRFNQDKHLLRIVAEGMPGSARPIREILREVCQIPGDTINELTDERLKTRLEREVKLAGERMEAYKKFDKRHSMLPKELPGYTFDPDSLNHN